MGPLTELAAEQTARTVGEIDQVLQLTEQMLDRLADGDAREEAVRRVLRRSVSRHSFLNSVFVLNLAGRIVLSSDGGGARVGVAAFEHAFLRQPGQDSRDTEFVIGAPVRDGSTGEWVIPATRLWRDANGDPIGTIGATIDPGYFAQIWKAEGALLRTSVALFRRDGVLLMCSPFVEALMGASPASPLPFDQQKQPVSAATFEAANFGGGAPQLLSFRTVATYPQLAVVVGQGMEQILAPWRSYALYAVAAWAAASAALAGLFLRLERAWSSRTLLASNLKDSRDQFRAVVDHTVDGVIIIDEHDTIEYFSSVAERMFGYSNAEVAGRDAHMLMPERYHSKHTGGIGAFLAAKQAAHRGSDREVYGRRKDGSAFPMDLAVGEMPAAVGGRRFVGTMRDTTASRTIEDQLRQSQKMESLGQLTGGVAHDFNNMLTVIIGNAEALIDRAEDPAVLAACEQILLAAEGSADLTSRLLAFSRQQPLQPKRIPVNPFVVRMKGLLQRALGETIDVKLVLSEDAWEASIDPSQLEAAIMNLAINARDAMPSGGRLTIETSNAQIDAGYAAATPDMQAGDFVMVAVSDDGAGMAPEIVQRAFEPFFTTKEFGKGTGLGLSMVYGFVRQSEGQVMIYSEPGQGTSVRMYLPRASGAGSGSTPERSAESVAPSRGETILIVEDDVLVRAHVAAQLSRRGYLLLQAENGPEAAEILAGVAKVDLLFTDMIMPGGMTGRDLAVRAQQLRPGIRVLFTSGYTQSAVMHHGRLDEGMHLLSKPYRLVELATKVREVLDA